MIKGLCTLSVAWLFLTSEISLGQSEFDKALETLERAATPQGAIELFNFPNYSYELEDVSGRHVGTVSRVTDGIFVNNTIYSRKRDGSLPSRGSKYCYFVTKSSVVEYLPGICEIRELPFSYIDIRYVALQGYMPWHWMDCHTTQLHQMLNRPGQEITDATAEEVSFTLTSPKRDFSKILRFRRKPFLIESVQKCNPSGNEILPIPCADYSWRIDGDQILLTSATYLESTGMKRKFSSKPLLDKTSEHSTVYDTIGQLKRAVPNGTVFKLYGTDPVPLAVDYLGDPNTAKTVYEARLAEMLSNAPRPD